MTHKITNASRLLASPPPLLRTFVLVSSAALALTFVILGAGNPSDDQAVQAQAVTPTPEPIDYDIDDDGLIEVRNSTQWRRIDDDRNGDGTPGPIDALTDANAWRNAFPNPMTGMGCQLTDHDNDPMTDDEPTCIGYELANDINTQEPGAPSPFRAIGYDSTSWAQRTYSAILKGNGYRVLNPSFRSGGFGNLALVGHLGSSGRIEGFGVINPDLLGSEHTAALVAKVSGTVIGNYALAPNRNRRTQSNVSGGLVGTLWGSGRLINSYFVGYTGEERTGIQGGGLMSDMNQDSATVKSLCRNSYFSGNILTLGGRGLIRSRIASSPPNNNVDVENCVGDTTTDPRTSNVWQGASPAENAQYGATKAEMIAPTDYSGPFANWNTDEDGDGELDDVWDFGDETQLPVLKGYGHDRTMPRTRTLRAGQDPAHTVNLCTRTLAVANEIIRHLQDDTWRTIAPPNAITSVPVAISALTPCRSNSDTATVSIDHLRDFVVTTPDNPFSLNPGRTSPPSDVLTSLHGDDLAYLFNAAHFDLSDNALSTIPPRLFQGMKVLQLDLSANAITSLHADTFEALSSPGQDYDTFIDLSENRLTAAGLPDRIFDDVRYITGLSLQSNALSEVNTRWFEDLVNLGRRDPMATSLAPVIGLHLGGNEITEHYYWQRAFDDVRLNQVSYEGDDPGATILTAIKAAMAEANTGANALDNLDIDYTVENIRNSVIATGACPDGLVSGPPGAIDIDGMPVQCEQVTRWTPPWVVGTSMGTATPSSDAPGGNVVITFRHPQAATGAPTITRYEMRFRLLPDDPGEAWHGTWRVLPIDLAPGQKTVTITGLQKVQVYQFQLRALIAGAPARPAAVTQSTTPDGTTGAAAQQPTAVSGRTSVRITFTHQPVTNEDPELQERLAITGYQIRHRPLPDDPSETWSQQWRNIELDISTPGPKTFSVEPLAEGTLFQFQLRPLSDGPVRAVSLTQGTRVALPSANSIVSTIREITVQAGQQIQLEVDIYDQQDVVDNNLADSTESKMLFRWTESPTGGGNFATPTTARRVTYTAPDLPGTYTVLAEAQPDGICTSHHASEVGISADDRAPCIATFTVRVSRSPGTAAPQTDPVNPAGLIPTSLTDSAGVSYAVFTPVDGGTFTGEGITVSAPEGAVPDQQLLGVTAARSDIPVPPPIPGARMTVAGSYYTVNGVQRSGDAPVSGYALDDPIQACIPLPDIFRADISDVVVVNRNPTDGSLAILTSNIQQTPAGLVACGAVGQLPATVAVANVGVIETPPDQPAPTDEDLPETGGKAPSATTIAWVMVAAMIMAVAATTAIARTARRRRSRNDASAM